MGEDCVATTRLSSANRRGAYGAIGKVANGRRRDEHSRHDEETHMSHSLRMAITGSTRLARRAGTSAATSATTASVIATAVNVAGSLG